MRRLVAIALASIIAGGSASPSNAVLGYTGCFASGDAAYTWRPSLLLIGTAVEVAGTGEGGRPTAFLVEVTSVILGNPADPFWVGAEDGSHYPRFGLGDRLLVARWPAAEGVPVPGTSDLSGCAWVVTGDGVIDYTRSPRFGGQQPPTLDELIAALSGAPPDTAMGHPSGPRAPIFLGLAFISAGAFLAIRLRRQRRAGSESRAAGDTI